MPGSTVMHLGIEVDDALEIAEQTELSDRRWRSPALSDEAGAVDCN